MTQTTRSEVRMRLARVSLWLAAIAFAGAGIAFLAAPSLLHLVDIAPGTATARSDARAMFGGLELGIAALLGLCARRPETLHIGLVAQALAFGGLVLGRLVSLAADGVPARITFGLWAAESLGAALAIVAARRLGGTSR
jgi:hypothetical protein